MKEGKHKRRKRIEIKLQGSFLVRSLRKLPQKPPKNPTTKAELPTCPHGVRLTQADLDFYEEVFGGRLFVLWGEEALPDDSNVGARPYDARTCVECHPVCAHGYQLSTEAVASAKVSGTKIASDCPACTASTDPKAWNAFLNEAGFSMFRGMNIAELYIPTCRGGVHALGQGKRLAYAGGFRKLDDIDAQSRNARDDMHARHKKPEGHGPHEEQHEEK